MINYRLATIGLLLSLLLGCAQADKYEGKFLNENAETLTTNFSKSIFSKEIINSKGILNALKTLSDSIYTDTAKYFRTPKATIYANNEAKTYFQIFENPKGTITAIAFYKNKNQINVAEYFENGQVMCKFNMTDDGVRDGSYVCFFEDGKFRIKGYYKNGKEIKDSLRTFNAQ